MFEKHLNITISLLTFILVASFGILFYFFAFDGLLFSDDISYAEYAYQLAMGKFHIINDIFNQRFGVFVPVAILYLIAGINDYTTTLYPFLCYLGVLIVLYVLFKKHTIVCCVSLILSSLCFYSIYFSNKLFPDVIISLFFLLLISFLIKRNKLHLAYSISGFIVSFFCGFLVKETIIYTVPFIILVFIIDFKSKQNLKFWFYSVCILFVLIGIYLWFYYYATGNPFYRIRVIHDGHYESGGSYYDKPFVVLLRRLTSDPVLMLLATELAIPVIVGLPLLFQFKKVSDEVKLWIAASVILTLSFWFGSTSLSFYNPIVLNGRMFIMLIPIWSIVAGFSFNLAVKNPKTFIMHSLIFFVSSILAVIYFDNTKLLLVYALLCICFLLYYYIVMHNKNILHWLFLLFAILLIHPTYTMLKSSSENHRALREIFLDIGKRNDCVLLVTDRITKHAYPYYYGFKIHSNLKVIDYDEFKTTIIKKSDAVLFLVSEKQLQELAGVGNTTPAFFKNPPATWELIKKKSDVTLYKGKVY